MTRPTIHTGPGIKVSDVRKAIKQAAKAGGDYHVQVDMRPTSAHDAKTLVRLALGAETFGKLNHGHYVESMPTWHRSGFAPDPAYESRMASWAAGIIERENEQRAADAPRRVAVTA